MLRWVLQLVCGWNGHDWQWRGNERVYGDDLLHPGVTALVHRFACGRCGALREYTEEEHA